MIGIHPSPAAAIDRFSRPRRKAQPPSRLDLAIALARLGRDREEKRLMTDVMIVATGLGFPEGPVVCADGSVVLTEIRNQRCSRVSPDGKVSVFSECGGGPNGLAIGPDGFFYCATMAAAGMSRASRWGRGRIPTISSA